MNMPFDEKIGTPIDRKRIIKGTFRSAFLASIFRRLYEVQTGRKMEISRHGKREVQSYSVVP
jgi:hypothetical protein